MKATVLIIGSEITRGIISDEHARTISHALEEAGGEVAEILILPDGEMIESELKRLYSISEIVIVTGGLGPTQDDLTRSAVAASLGLSLVRDENTVLWLRSILHEKAASTNLAQADFPAGSIILPNPHGTAPGFAIEREGRLVVALPGPPREAAPMFFDYALPIIRERLGSPEAQRDEYTSFLTPEARLEEIFERASKSLTFGDRFQGTRISVYISGGDERERAEAAERISSEVGPYRFIKGDIDLSAWVREIMVEKGVTLAVAESLTGGTLSALLAETPGASDYYLGSVTSYSYSAKENVLSVPHDVIERYGAVSKETAIFMADGVKRLFSSDYALSLTGVAGPSLQEGKPIGHVEIGIASPERTVTVTVELGTMKRVSTMRRASVAAMLLLIATLNGDDPVSIASLWKHL